MPIKSSTLDWTGVVDVAMVLETASDWVMLCPDDINQSVSRMRMTSKGVLRERGR